MRIAKLEISNFRSYATTTLELDRLNIFRGLHGSGKTSVQMALEYLFTGRCALTDAAGRGAEDLEGLGKDGFYVRAFTEDGGYVMRKRARGATQLVCAGADAIPFTGKAADAWLSNHFGSATVIAALLNSFRFLVMNDKERQSMLAAALASDPITLAPNAVAACMKFNLGLGLDGTVSTAADVERLHKAAFEMRTQVNRDLKNLGLVFVPVSPHPEYTSADARAQIETLMLEQAGLSHARTAGAVAYANHKAARDGFTIVMAVHEKDLLDTAEIDRLQVIVRNKGQAAKLKAELATHERAKRDIENNRRDLDRELANALSADKTGKCGSCGQTIAGALENRQARITQAENAINLSTATLAQADAAVANIQAEIDALGDDPDVAQRKLDAHQEAMKKWTVADGERRKLGKLGPEPVVGEESVEEQELARRIAKGREIERALLTFEGGLAQATRQQEQERKLRLHVSELEQLLQYFSPEGPVKAALVGGRLPGFITRINEVLERFGFVCDFKMDPFTLKVAGEGWPRMLHLHQLSESQAFRFSIAFQIALAEATGFGLVVIDRADVLLPEVRATLTDELVESRLAQAFILAASEDSSIPDDLPEGVAFFNLAQDSRGVTTVLAGGGKAEVTYAATE